MAGQVRLTWAMGWRLCSACSSAWAASWRSVASIISGLSSVSVCAALQHGGRRALPAGLAGDRGLGQPSLPWLDHEMVVQRVPGAMHVVGRRGLARVKNVLSDQRPRHAELHISLQVDRKSTRLNSSHLVISYAVFCLKKKKINTISFIIITINGHLYKYDDKSLYY